MQYQVMMLDVHRSLYQALKYRFGGMDVTYTMALTMQDVMRLCAEQPFHLFVLKFPDFILCSEFFCALRRVTLAPVIALIDKYSVEDARSVLQSGADLCVDCRCPIDLIADHIMAQFRRYTSYNQTDGKQERGASFLQCGDIYIDPLRRVVRVKERNVKLRRREFQLLLYFMNNPKIILSAEQICDHAWGNEGSYANGVSGPIAILRKAIEPDPSHPVYIKTAKTAGYYFTSYNSETCDICSDFVGIL